MSNSENSLAVVQNPQELMRISTDVAGLCKQIVIKSALDIQGRKYVRVEGWMSIATAHGCIASSRDVERVEGGFRAIGELKRMSDGAVLATAEGFVGEDEPTWFGGDTGNKTLPKRPDYAIRAMTQTRAISRVCRSAFAHVVVLMDAGLSTTPAEEVPHGGFTDMPTEPTTKPTEYNGHWSGVICHIGKPGGPLKDKILDELKDSQRGWLIQTLEAKEPDRRSAQDKKLLAALLICREETMKGPKKETQKKAPVAGKTPGAEKLQQLNDDLEWSQVPAETFMRIVRTAKLTNAERFQDITEEEAAEMLAQVASLIEECEMETGVQNGNGGIN